MIPLQSFCRLQNLCKMQSVLSQRIHTLCKHSPQQIFISHCIPKRTKFETIVWINPGLTIDFLSLREVRSFSSDSDSRLVHVLDSNNNFLHKMSLKMAHIFAHKEGMKLFHIPKESAEKIDEFKLLSNAEFQKEVSKYKVEKMKEVHLSVYIHENDLNTKLAAVKQRLCKGTSVRVVLTSHGKNLKRFKQGGLVDLEGKLAEDADRIIAACVEITKDIAVVTKAIKGKKKYLLELKNNNS
ncbi:uncharacterized protein LOC132557780 [Ylistrum balloti]|uniref:uncharacterized protein LOC132557780 n=1 Tax=Ylistrum balloti TaxID=509963 RepID=UPI002905F58B|nr:uncharacterized protein LOC132557780 [Ylistrum balloti]